jgi:16S rRNA (cytosine967-C5)-methyltransferase
MQQVQQSAARVICRVLLGRNLNQSLDEELRAMPGYSSQQRGAMQDMSYGTLRFYGQLAAILAQLLHKPVQDSHLRCLLLVALYQLLHTKAAPYAVVDHAVRAARHRNVGAGKLANAVLRNFLRKKETLLTEANSTEEGRYSYPQWWIDELRKQYAERAEAILEAGNLHPPMTLRVNQRRISSHDYLALLAQQGIQASLIEPGAVLLARPVPVSRLPGFGEGMVSVQDAGAQYAAHLLDVHDSMRVLDACAAPGGKTAHLLELAQVHLVAVDREESRLERVRENLRRLHLSAYVYQGDAANPDDWWDGKPFQRILADVPCSASGVVRRHPDIKQLRRYKDIVGFSQHQTRILSALWQLLESDGKLLYVTCSVFKQENQQVIAEFMCQHSDARQLPLTIQGMDQGQLLPNDQHDGFYYSLLHKQV